MANEVYTGEISKLISEKGRYIVLDSPFIDNDILVLINPLEENPVFRIFKYIYDPTEPEIKLYYNLSRSEKINSGLGEEIAIELVMPGQKKGEIIIVSKTGFVWRAYLKKDKVELVKKVGNLNPTPNLEFDFFSLYEPEDLVIYFTKKTKEFAGLIVKERDRFSILLNSELFTGLGDDEKIIEFENSIPFWNSERENLDLFSFNENSGLAHLSFPVNKKNTPVPISILNLKKIKEIPTDICCVGTAIYVITTDKLYIYPNFRKYKTMYELELPLNFQCLWFEPHLKLCKLFSKGQFYSFTIYPTISEIKLKKFGSDKIEDSISKSSVDRFEIKSIGNKQVYLINLGDQSYLVFKKEHLNQLKTHEIILYNLEKPIPDALESLQRLRAEGSIKLDAYLAITEGGIPRGLLRRIKQKDRFSKDDELFIVKHAYKDLTFSEIAKKLDKTQILVESHSKNLFGTPSCDTHDDFEPLCDACQNERELWEDSCLDYIEKKIYPKFFDFDEDSDNEEYRRQRKYNTIYSRTHYFRELLPSEMYETIIDFILNTDLIKGRSLEDIFSQCIRFFIGDFLESLNIEDFQFPIQLLEIYYNIRPRLKILSLIQKDYLSLVNQKYHPLENTKVYFLKDVYYLSKLYTEKINNTLYPILLNFYQKLRKLTAIKDGYLGGLVYLSLLETKNQLSQFKLAQFFEITEVTLRTRKKEIDKNEVLRKYIFEFINIIENADFLSTSHLKINNS